ncbi:PREDICTED: dynein regulatory complex subunit 7-like [Trachymyrmex cornetzi]|uniref:dynein regulatory complex subunit 7-like n=1 Tax=Trachymyrmex cornetzi TaxID=471704 RepID=UPI00084EF12A|nr:PREDICTED: dynein regulatory complex subunit 7-like [Trachymyrmex cornetzi]
MTNLATEKQFDFDALHPSSLDKRPEDEHDIEKSTSTVEEILQQVQRELCLIKLCWPDVAIITEDLYVRSLPNTYRCVNDKERLLLWYAENFRRQFHAKYSNRRPLLLACENEYRVQKFVSTSIKRSTLPYPEIYTWRGCVQFISDNIEYQPLAKAFITVSKQTIWKEMI